MADNNCSILFTGLSGLLFTDEKGKEYIVNTETIMTGTHDKVLFSKRITPIDRERKLSEKDRELIVSKILNLTKDIRWLIQ